jgi:single-strand DNA-binding protein
MIRATVTGNLGRDPELKDTRSGKKMVTFSVASTMKREGRDPETTWLDVVCFDRLAEDAAGTFRKGMKVLLTGELSLETFKRNDGAEGTALRMVANDIGLCVRSKQEQDQGGSEPRQRPPQRTASRNEPW